MNTKKASRNSRKENSAKGLCEALRCALADADRIAEMNDEDAPAMMKIKEDIRVLIGRVNAIRQKGTKPGQNAFWSEYLERWVTVPEKE